MVEFTLDGNAVGIGHKTLVVLPNGHVAFHEGFDCLDGVFDGLLVLGTARSLDVGGRFREERVVLERHQHLVVDVADDIFFFVLEVAIAKARIRHGDFFGIAVKAVSQEMRVGGVGCHARIHAERGVGRNLVDRDGQELSGILAEVAFVVDVDAVQVANDRASHVHRADSVQQLVSVLQ